MRKSQVVNNIRAGVVNITNHYNYAPQKEAIGDRAIDVAMSESAGQEASLQGPVNLSGDETKPVGQTSGIASPAQGATPTQADDQNWVSALNYLRKVRDDVEDDQDDGARQGADADMNQQYRRWELEGTYDIPKLYSSKTARMVEAHDGTKPALAIVLSCNVASRIERALVAGREFQKMKKEIDDKLQQLQSSRDQRSDAAHDTQQQDQVRTLEADLQKAKDKWIQHWLEVNPIMDLVWVGAAILPWEEDEKAGDEPVNLAPKEPSGHSVDGVPPERRTLDDFTIKLVDVADRARDLMAARDNFDNYCHNYRRHSERYVEQRQRWDKRSPEQIRQEFPLVFAENVRLERAKVCAARDSYMSAYDRAREAGIPHRCLRYVEPVDVDSEDTLELLEDEASNLRRGPRRQHRAGPYQEGTSAELYLPRERVANWRKHVQSDAPLQDTSLSYDAVNEKDQAKQQELVLSDIRDESIGCHTRLTTSSNTRQQHHSRLLPNPELRTSRSQYQHGSGQGGATATNLPKKKAKVGSALPEGPGLAPSQPSDAPGPSGSAAEASQGRLIARISESTERELQGRAGYGPSINLWKPQADIKFSTALPTTRSKDQGPSAQKTGSAFRIAEVRNILARQRHEKILDGKKTVRMETTGTKGRKHEKSSGSKREHDSTASDSRSAKRSRNR